ncbi:MAG TPA: hypothetical protein VEO01_40955 [Pseudonocardiaceae bacterium]|nr:hypothetical protein [Pseudonocardiaceae bacterium]
MITRSGDHWRIREQITRSRSLSDKAQSPARDRRTARDSNPHAHPHTTTPRDANHRTEIRQPTQAASTVTQGTDNGRRVPAALDIRPRTQPDWAYRQPAQYANTATTEPSTARPRTEPDWAYRQPTQCASTATTEPRTARPRTEPDWVWS